MIFSILTWVCVSKMAALAHERSFESIFQSFLLPSLTPTLVHFMNPHGFNLPQNLRYAVIVTSNLASPKPDWIYGLRLNETTPDRTRYKKLTAWGCYRALHVHLVSRDFNHSSVVNKWWETHLQHYNLRYFLNEILNREVPATYLLTNSWQGNHEAYSRHFDIHLTLAVATKTYSNHLQILEYVKQHITTHIDAGNIYCQHFFTKILIITDGKHSNQETYHHTYLYCQQASSFATAKFQKHFRLTSFTRKFQHCFNKITVVRAGRELEQRFRIRQSKKEQRNWKIMHLDYELLIAGTPQNFSIQQGVDSVLFRHQCKLSIDQLVILDVTWYPTLVVKNRFLQFLTLDGGEFQEGMSFAGYISAFDKTTWVLISGIFLLMVFAITIDGNLGKTHSKTKILCILLENGVAVLRIFLFQGTEIKCNRILLPVQLWTVCIFILGYFYLGDNIGEITAPKRINFFDKFEDILERKYSIEVSTAGYFNAEVFKLHYFCRKRLPETVCRFLYESAFGGTYGSLFEKWLQINTTESRLVQRLAYYGQNITYSFYDHDFMKIYEKHAVINWCDNLDVIETKLMKSLSNAVTNKPVIVARSEKKWFTQQSGMAFFNWYNPYSITSYKAIWTVGIFDRLKSLKENYGNLLMRSNVLRAANHTVYHMKNKMESKFNPLDFSGNTVVVFIVYGASILCCVFFLVAENHSLSIHQARVLVAGGRKYCFKLYAALWRFVQLYKNQEK